MTNISLDNCKFSYACNVVRIQDQYWIFLFVGIADKGEEEVTIVLPGVSVGIVQKFLEFFYTGYTALIDKNDVAEFQDFLYNLMVFTGPVSINDVYDEPPNHVIEAR
jgi:hypothetical protein